jgi:cation diffusion facilitator family transporter
MTAPSARVGRHDEAAHRQAANRAVAVSAVGLAVTGGVEMALALFTGSVGLLGDALHNLSDVSTSAVVFLSFRVSKRRPTPHFPYGYERAEDLAGLGVALVIWASAVLAGIESYRKLVGHSTTSHVGWGMVGAVLGIVGNQAVARYKLATGKRIQSATLVADARHSWLDALSSAGAFVGLVGVGLGYRWADPVAGFVITAFIAHVGWEVTTEIAGHLMDAVDASLTEQAHAAAEGVAGVLDAEVRGRWSGRTLRLEIEVELAAKATLAEAAHVSQAVEAAVFNAVGEARHVHVSTRPRRGSCTRQQGAA